MLQLNCDIIYLCVCLCLRIVNVMVSISCYFFFLICYCSILLAGRLKHFVVLFLVAAFVASPYRS